MSKIRKGKEDTDFELFTITGEDGRIARQLLVKESLRYFNDYQDCGWPACVVDKLQKAHGWFMRFNCDSLKNEIRKIIHMDEIKSQIQLYFDNMKPPR